MNKDYVILRLSVPIVDRIGNLLATHPYNQVKDILDTLVIQANDRELQSYAPPPPPAEKKE
jgi:hypothetical protein